MALRSGHACNANKITVRIGQFPQQFVRDLPQRSLDAHQPIEDSGAMHAIGLRRVTGQDDRPHRGNLGSPDFLNLFGWNEQPSLLLHAKLWLTRIEVTDHRFAGRFMARDYVQVREEQRNGQTLWTFATVSHTRLKSAPAKVTKRGNRYTIVGVAWGAPIAAVQVRIDDGPWRTARLFGHPPRGKSSSGYAWRFWTFDWGTPAPGEHRITSRAFDIEGNVQPAPDDPFLASKRTYWENNGHITRRVSIT